MKMRILSLYFVRYPVKRRRCMHMVYNTIVLVLCTRTLEQQLVAVETKAIDP